MTSPVELSVVIPCYFSEASIGELVEQLHLELSGWCDDYEILLVNDGSTDQTWPTLERLAAASEKVRAIDLMRNFGQHNALFAGISKARLPLVVTMDDDLQHPPKEIKTLYEHLGTNDLVYGAPVEEQHGWWRDLASVITKWAIERGLGVKFAAESSAFRLFRRQAAQSMSAFSGAFVDIDALLCWNTRRVASVRVEHLPRKYGRSTHSFRSLVSHAINMVALFTTLPLKLISVLGFFFTVFGIGVLAYLLLNYFLGEAAEVEGFTFLASLITIFAGATLFALGVIGEYLARVHYQTLGYPTAVIRTELGAPLATGGDEGAANRSSGSRVVGEAAVPARPDSTSGGDDAGAGGEGAADEKS